MTKPSGLVVAHGQPTAPDGPEADLGKLAERVANLLPGWRIASATLAAPGALERAADAVGPTALVYPLFMSQGWFVGTELPRRLRAAGLNNATILPPLGLDPSLPDLCTERAKSTNEGLGLAPQNTALLLVGHGSPSNSRAARPVHDAARAISARKLFRAVTVGFVDEAPFLADAARGLGQAVCLPYFAAANGHVREDIPLALKEAQFEGHLMEPIGTDPMTPDLIAQAFLRYKPTHAHNMAK